MDDLFKALPYLVGLIATILADRRWLYGKLREEKEHYEKEYQAKEAEVEKLKDRINQLKIEMIKLKASQRGAFFDRKDKK